jgi:hypothetical protein
MLLLEEVVYSGDNLEREEWGVVKPFVVEARLRAA